MTCAKEEAKIVLGIIFPGYLIMSLRYYIFISRTKYIALSDWLGAYSSYFYSLYLLLFLNSLNTPMPDLEVSIFFITFFAVFTFSLLSLSTTEDFTNLIDDLKKEHPKLFGIIFLIILVGFLIWITLYAFSKW
ncbi:MAG: hypothetical protein DRP06_00110 [Candidatus Aenigmatarchaeota archaeon]|nr:MAG: hypothetical protein DRP06_00110 [Candidatus Aenigmarchaeota archaeon]